LKLERTKTDLTNNGISNTTKLPIVKNLDGQKVNHSTLDPDFQCIEFYKLMETTVSKSTDGSRTDQHNNGSSIVIRCKSKTRTGKTITSIFQVMEETMISISEPMPHQLGTTCGNFKVHSLSIQRTAKSSMFMEEPIKKTEMLLSGTNTEESTNNGMLSSPVNIQKIQRRENSTRTTVYTLIDHSTSSLNCHKTDTFLTSTTETW